MQIPKGPITNILVIINIVIAAILVIPNFWEWAVVQGGFIPARLINDPISIVDNGFYIPAILTPITSAFLHSGLVHLVMNMLILLLMGRFVEGALGNYFIIIYGIGICAADAMELIIDPYSTTPIIGASGGISAIIAVYLLYFPKYEPQDWMNIPAHIIRPIKLLAGWILLNLLLGFVSPNTGLNIAIYAHIGGFIAGLLLAKPMLTLKHKKQ